MSGTTRSTCHMPHVVSSVRLTALCFAVSQFGSCLNHISHICIYIYIYYTSKLMAVMQAVKHECVSHHVHTDTQRVFRGNSRYIYLQYSNFKMKRKNILKYFMHFINQILTNLIILKLNSDRYYFHLLLANRIETQSDSLNGFAIEYLLHWWIAQFKL